MTGDDAHNVILQTRFPGSFRRNIAMGRFVYLIERPDDGATRPIGLSLFSKGRPSLYSVFGTGA